MSEAISTLMTVEEFLAWPGKGDTRYQLRDGTPVAMAPPAAAQRVIVANLVAAISRSLGDHSACTVQVEVGIRSPSNARACHQADLAVTCRPLEKGEQEMVEPMLIAEIMSTGTAGDDRSIKLPDYRTLPSVREIVLLDSRLLYGEVHRRLDHDRWLVELLREPEARVTLTSVGLDLPLGTLYRNVPL